MKEFNYLREFNSIKNPNQDILDLYKLVDYIENGNENISYLKTEFLQDLFNKNNNLVKDDLEYYQPYLDYLKDNSIDNDDVFDGWLNHSYSDDAFDYWIDSIVAECKYYMKKDFLTDIDLISYVAIEYFNN